MAPATSDRRTVLVVDDSPFVRRVVRDVIDAAPDFVVVGEASDGYAALRQVHALSPDLVTLDVEMPALDGLQTLGYVMSEAPRPVVMLSALDSRDGADLTLRALELGAVDFVRKPARDDGLDLATLRVRLLSALRAAAESRCGPVPLLTRALPRLTPKPSDGASKPPSRVVVIAASTGGPRALSEIVPALPPLPGTAVLIVQHMPSGFTRSLARRLDELSVLRVTEARDGEALVAGRVWVAPGGTHLLVRPEADGSPRLAVAAGPPIHGVRPAADPLLQSVAACFGARVVAVILTGMGSDGAAGLAAVRAAGGFAIVQDRESSIVYGMPQAALARAGADRVSPLGGVAAAILAGLSARGAGERAGA